MHPAAHPLHESAVVDVTFKEEPAAKLVLINPVIVSKEGRQRSTKAA